MASNDKLIDPIQDVKDTLSGLSKHERFELFQALKKRKAVTEDPSFDAFRESVRQSRPADEEVISEDDIYESTVRSVDEGIRDVGNLVVEGASSEAGQLLGQAAKVAIQAHPVGRFGSMLATAAPYVGSAIGAATGDKLYDEVIRPEGEEDSFAEAGIAGLVTPMIPNARLATRAEKLGNYLTSASGGIYNWAKEAAKVRGNPAKVRELAAKFLLKDSTFLKAFDASPHLISFYGNVPSTGPEKHFSAILDRLKTRKTFERDGHQIGFFDDSDLFDDNLEDAFGKMGFRAQDRMKELYSGDSERLAANRRTIELHSQDSEVMEFLASGGLGDMAEDEAVSGAIPSIIKKLDSLGGGGKTFDELGLQRVFEGFSNPFTTRAQKKADKLRAGPEVVDVLKSKLSPEDASAFDILWARGRTLSDKQEKARVLPRVNFSEEDGVELAEISRSFSQILQRAKSAKYSYSDVHKMRQAYSSEASRLYNAAGPQTPNQRIAKKMADSLLRLEDDWARDIHPGLAKQLKDLKTEYADLKVMEKVAFAADAGIRGRKPLMDRLTFGAKATVVGRLQREVKADLGIIRRFNVQQQLLEKIPRHGFSGQIASKIEDLGRISTKLGEFGGAIVSVPLYIAGKPLEVMGGFGRKTAQMMNNRAFSYEALAASVKNGVAIEILKEMGFPQSVEDSLGVDTAEAQGMGADAFQMATSETMEDLAQLKKAFQFGTEREMRAAVGYMAKKYPSAFSAPVSGFYSEVDGYLTDPGDIATYDQMISADKNISLKEKAKIRAALNDPEDPGRMIKPKGWRRPKNQGQDVFGETFRPQIPRGLIN